jgi:peptidoglycan/LPS O-acetylase OafA/YrhL
LTLKIIRWRRLILLVMTLVVVIALSAVTWRFVEQPIIRRLR